MKPLKKEFSDKDKKRMRALLTGNESKRETIGIGYRKVDEIHNEGDIWEEDDRKWTIKNGIKQNITKLDKLKQHFIVPIFCPHCSSQMKHKFDNDFYKVHGKCYSCVIKFETELRRLGLFEEYEKNIINSNIDGIIKDFTAYIYDRITENESSSYITETGVIEKWDGNLDKDRVLQSLKDTIEFLNKFKK